jgi:hypothetical protein
MGPRKIAAFVVLAMAFVAVQGPTQAGDLSARPRIALVVGNGAYQYLPRLANPANG